MIIVIPVNITTIGVPVFVVLCLALVLDLSRVSMFHGELARQIA